MSRDEVARVRSPDGAYDAVLFETNVDATTDFGYEVRVVRHGGTSDAPPAVTLYGATRNEHAYGANLRWSTPRQVDVEYLEARSTQQNAAAVTVGQDKITVVLRPGVADPAAPAGGMAYNLH